MKEKQLLFIFALKWNEVFGSKSKRKENTEAKRSKKKNLGSKKKQKHLCNFFCLEVIQKIGSDLRSEKTYVKFPPKHAKRKRNESNFALFLFEVKRNLWSGTGAP